MSPFDFIRDQINESVPFANHCGVEVICLNRGEGAARLSDDPITHNHVNTHHAGALFTLGEAASGAAMAGTFAPVLLSSRAVVSDARISFKRPAMGEIHSIAKLSEDADVLLNKLQTDSEVSFQITVAIIDTEDTVAAKMEVDWHIRKSAHQSS